ncbi:PHP domain-containing protein [Legionella fairfieldensis]|uniref:PHP domain-containing protein n=1 Tax=Legionella fairfieldensis TaxID=45064 RepID=UPI0004916660|nr:PHP domain-containing protein [Legionella fairfieldensis]
MIDLHCHSNCSDGKLSPADLLDKALASGVQILALTDHDTTDGLTPLRKAAHTQAIKIVNGIELSTSWKKYDIHVVGLGIDPDNTVIQTLIKQQNESRITRALQIAEKMKACKVDDAYAKACKIAGHNRIGRPHFAQVFIEEGVVADAATAFKRFLGRGKPAYVPTPWLTIQEAVAGIVEAGGQAVLAHPLKYALTRTKLQELISEFKRAGGVGMEVVSGEMTVTQVNDMAGLCLRYDLLASTGSDYHGDNVSRVSLGKQRPLPLNCTPIWYQWTI